MRSHKRSLLPLLLVMVPVVTTAIAASPWRQSQAQAIAALRTELRQEVADGRFSGAVLIAKDDQAVFEAAYGYANRAKKIKNTVDTKFHFGSMGKMFTAVAVLQLVQNGKIGLDDPVSKFLPDYPNKGVAAVTIYQLLTHTGGTGDIFGPEFDANRSRLKTLADYVALYGHRDLVFQPGSRWDYSNYGFLLLGRIVEVVSGESYYEYVRRHIFEPAGMQSTGNQPEDQNVPDLAVGYTRAGLLGPGPGPGPGRGAGPGPGSGPGESMRGPGPGPGALGPVPSGPVHSTEGMLPYRGTSAGGGYSTVGDFLKFAIALQSHKLLDAHYTELLTLGKVVTPRPGIKYAFGFEDETTPDGARLYGHGGGSPGMNGKLSIFRSSGYLVIVLANLDPPAADALAQFVDQRLPAH